MRLHIVTCLALATVACFAEEGGGGGEVGEGSSESGQGSGTTTNATTVGTTAAEGTGESGSTTTEGGPSCTDGSTCVTVPAGWSGPVAVLEGDGDCDGQAPAFAGGDALDAPPAACECTCGSIACQVALEAHANSNMCDQLLSTTDVVANTCVDVPEGALLLQATVTTAAPADSCEATLESSVPEATWTPAVRGCSAPPEPACPGACVGEEPVCVFANADLDCPPGPFSSRRLIFTGVDDERDCSECACQLTQAAQCNDFAMIELSNPGDCSEPVLMYPPGCFGPGGTARLRYLAQYPGYCSAAAPSDPVGEASPTDPVTICCTA